MKTPRLCKAMSVSRMIQYARAVDAALEANPPPPGPSLDELRALPPVVLVACCAKKRGRRCQARELYQSDLFRKSSAYAERLSGEWFILSAKYHLVAPTDELPPYDRRLDELTTPERRDWAKRVFEQLRWRGLIGRRFVVLAGDLYRADLEALLAAAGSEVTVPMRGLGIGYQRQWLARELTQGETANA